MSNPFAGAAAAPQTAPAAQPATQGNPFGGAQAPAAQTPPAAPAADAFAAPPSTVPETAPAAGGDPFGLPSGGGSGAKIADDLGQALLVRPTELRAQMQTQNGVTDAIQADWIVLTGPEAGQIREGSLVFQVALVSDLKRILANPSTPFMVGVLSQGAAKPGKSAPYIFDTPGDEHIALARQAAAHYGWI